MSIFNDLNLCRRKLQFSDVDPQTKDSTYFWRKRFQYILTKIEILAFWKTLLPSSARSWLTKSPPPPFKKWKKCFFFTPLEMLLIASIVAILNRISGFQFYVQSCVEIAKIVNMRLKSKLNSCYIYRKCNTELIVLMILYKKPRDIAWFSFNNEVAHFHSLDTFTYRYTTWYLATDHDILRF